MEVGTLLLLIALVLYFVPAIIASTRKHHQRGAITVLNILLGWTLLGWIIALVWACTAVRYDLTPEARRAARRGAVADFVDEVNTHPKPEPKGVFTSEYLNKMQ